MTTTTIVLIILVSINLLLLASFLLSILWRKKLKLQLKANRLILRINFDNSINVAILKIKQLVSNNSKSNILEVKHNSQIINGSVNNVSTNASDILSKVSSMTLINKLQKLLNKKNHLSLKRILNIIAGTQSKGLAGLNIIDTTFSLLPVEWQVRNFQVNGKPVLFGIKLSNNTIIPIDSKFSSTNLITKYQQLEDSSIKKKIKSDIELALFKKAKLVAKYIDPSITGPYGLMVVPDVVYGMSSSISILAFNIKVIIISYSMFLPYVLLCYQSASTQGNVNVLLINQHITSICDNITLIQLLLDGRLSRAMTMLLNTKNLIRVNLNKAKNSSNYIRSNNDLGAKNNS